MGKFKKKKRLTFKSMLLFGFVLVMVITMLFATVSDYIYYKNIKEQCNERKLYTVHYLQAQITEWKRTPEQLSFYFNNAGAYEILNVDSFSKWLFPRFYSPVVLTDSNGDVKASNAVGMKTTIGGYPKFGGREYYCWNNTDIPEVAAMLRDCSDLVSMYYKSEADHYINFELDSIYVDDDKWKFVPHTGKMQLCRQINKKDRSGIEVVENDDIIIAEREINITLNEDGYELLKKSTEDKYKRFYADFTGVPDKFIEMVMDPHLNYRGYYSDGEPERYDVYIDGEKYYLYTKVFSQWYSTAEIFQITVMSLIGFVLSTIIMLLICWRKNVRNKARYRFEDFQKNITDYLITNISGPVEAIEKYTKDLIDNNGTDSKNVIIDDNKERYESIIENVRTVDKIVSDALFYNNMDRIRKKTSEEKQLADNIPPELVKNIL